MLIIASSCKKELISEEPYDCYYETFVIVNHSNHSVKIENCSFNNMELIDEFSISINDSLMIQKTNCALMQPIPFDAGYVFISFDNEEKSLCNHSKESGIRNPVSPIWYKTDKTEDGNLISRYVITEEDYEYAKAHPYVEGRE